jgi:hypothetical protein
METAHMNDTIDFTPEAVKQYLVAAVQKWRATRDSAVGNAEWTIAQCYVDAFQSVHTTLFGTLVPQENHGTAEK